jgi:hypothetical protein
MELRRSFPESIRSSENGRVASMVWVRGACMQLRDWSAYVDSHSSECYQTPGRATAIRPLGEVRGCRGPLKTPHFTLPRVPLPRRRCWQPVAGGCRHPMLERMVPVGLDQRALAPWWIPHWRSGSAPRIFRVVDAVLHFAAWRRKSCARRRWTAAVH